MVCREAAIEPRVEPSSGVHLHQQGGVPVLPLLGLSSFEVHEEGSPASDEHGEHGQGVAPGYIVVVGVKKPLAVPAEATKEGDTEEEEDSDDALHDKSDEDKIPFKTKHMFHGNAKEKTGINDLSQEGEQEGQGCHELHQHQPPGGHPLSDLPVLCAPDRSTPIKHPVILVLGVAEPVEAELPEPHVEEGGLRVGPGGEPVGGGEAHEEEDSPNKSSDAGIE